MYSCTIELPKLYIQSITKIQINLVRLGRQGTPITNKLLCPTFERGFFKFTWANKVSVKHKNFVWSMDRGAIEKLRWNKECSLSKVQSQLL